MRKTTAYSRRVKRRRGSYDVLDKLEHITIVFPIDEKNSLPLHIATAWLRHVTAMPTSAYFASLVKSGHYTPHQNKPSTGVFFAGGPGYPVNPVMRVGAAALVFEQLARGATPHQGGVA